MSTITCRRCHQPTKPEDLAKDRQANHPTLCKLCVSEQAKASIRYRILLPRYIALVDSFPQAKLQSEYEWLTDKLRVVREQLKLRRAA